MDLREKKEENIQKPKKFLNENERLREKCSLVCNFNGQKQKRIFLSILFYLKLNQLLLLYQ